MEYEYEQFNTLHYKVENELLKLIKSLQKKQNANDWKDTFLPDNH